MKPLAALLLLASLTVAHALDPGATRGLAQITPAMESEIAANHAAGVVTLVMKDGKIVHHAAAGFADREKNLPMREDALFWIASMTKSISATTIMTLVDEALLSLDEPASSYLPSLAKVTLSDGSPPQRPITLRDLMSHSSGLAFPPRKPTDGAQSLGAYAEALVKAPLEFEPGSAYRYGFGITVSGRIAEIVSGKSFDALVQERILDPLGMTDTTFHPGDAQRARIARTYKTAEDGKSLIRGYNPFVTSDSGVRRMTEPSGGLFSTAAEMATFYQMILAGGLHEGKRIVSEKSVAAMTTPHSAGGKLLNYGLGWMCNNSDKKIVPGYSERAFGHGGAFATHGWVDPGRGTVAVFMVQDVLLKGAQEPRNAFHENILAAFPD